MLRANALQASRQARLRCATQTIHRRVETIIADGKSLASHRGYNAYLLATLRARSQVEADLDASQAHIIYPLWPHRKVEGALRADLADLAVTDHAIWPVAMQSGLTFTCGEVLGALYVLEGSALGAQILKRQVAELGLGTVFGARHLAQQTAEPGAWRSYLTCLETAPFTRSDDELCVNAAVRTFLTFERAYAAMA